MLNTTVEDSSNVQTSREIEMKINETNTNRALKLDLSMEL